MRRTGEIDLVTVLALIDELDFLTFTEEGDYATYPYRYLMREPKGSRCQEFYDQHRTLGGWGGNPDYIRGQLYLSRVVPGHLPPVPNQRDNISDSDGEDPDGEGGVPQAAVVVMVPRVVPIFKQPAQDPLVREQPVPKEQRQVPEGV